MYVYGLLGFLTGDFRVALFDEFLQVPVQSWFYLPCTGWRPLGLFHVFEWVPRVDESNTDGFALCPHPSVNGVDFVVRLAGDVEAAEEADYDPSVALFLDVAYNDAEFVLKGCAGPDRPFYKKR